MSCLESEAVDMGDHICRPAPTCFFTDCDLELHSNGKFCIKHYKKELAAKAEVEKTFGLVS